jgi:hypothetical protein
VWKEQPEKLKSRKVLKEKRGRVVGTFSRLLNTEASEKNWPGVRDLRS